MSKKCPLYGDTVLYLDCLECEDKKCKEVEKMNTYVKAKKGYRFTSTSKADDRIRAKYIEEKCSSKSILLQYRYNAPLSWIQKGYVIEIKDDAHEE